MAKCVVSVTRDSVAAGDDMDAPHAYSFAIEDTAEIRALLRHLINRRYLAKVSGTGHQWEAKIGDEVVAVFLGNRRSPEPTPLLKAPVSRWITGGKVALNFRYVSAMS